jgi:hypothetical protein
MLRNGSSAERRCCQVDVRADRGLLGHLHVLQWLHSLKVLIPPDACEFAATQGNLEIVQVPRFLQFAVISQYTIVA